MIRRTLALLVPLVLLVACSSPTGTGQESQGGGGGGESAAESMAPGESAAASVGGGGGGGGGDGLATAEVVVDSGDFAGTYNVTITAGGCSRGVTGPGTFAVASSSVAAGAEPFDGPQLTLYDAAAAAAGTDNFSAAFTFNTFANTLEVSPAQSRGTGTATLDDRGDTATVTIEGTSLEGPNVTATIECHEVADFG